MKREAKVTFPGCHGNIPAPHFSIIPEHRDISLSDVKETREREREREKKNRQSEAEKESETRHAFEQFLITLHTASNTKHYLIFRSGFSGLFLKIQLYIISNNSTLTDTDTHTHTQTHTHTHTHTQTTW